jgi:hypothetical protein
MNSLAVCKQGLINVLKRIKPSNGFTNDLSPAQILGRYDSAFVNQLDDLSYPKVMVVVDSGETTPLPAQQQHRTILFHVFVIVKALQETDDPVAMTESYIEDVEKAVYEDSSLDGTVDEAHVEGFTCDGGIKAPEGIAIITIEALRTTH